MKRWKEAAKYCEEKYKVTADYGEKFFMCPECGEPIYASDYPSKKDWDECPVCDFNFRRGSMLYG